MVFFLKESVFTPVKKFKLKLLIIRTQVVKKAEGAFLNRAVANHPLKTNSGNTTRSRYIGPKPSLQTPEWYHWHCSVATIVNPAHISHTPAVSPCRLEAGNGDMVGIS